MRILMISSFFPYPLYSGGQVRLYNLLRQISKKNRITLICPIKSYKEQKYLPKIEKFCQKVILTHRGTQWSWRNIVMTAFSGYPFLFVGHRSEEMKRKIVEELNKENYNLIQVETSYVMPNIPQTDIPIVLSEYNIEYSVYQRYAENFKFFPLKPFLYFDVWKMKFCEENTWRKANFVITVREEDKKKIVKSGISEDRVFVISNRVDIERFKLHKTYRTDKTDRLYKLLFVGDFRWFPNRDAVGWLMRDIWPKIKLKAQSSKLKAHLFIVGRGSEYLTERGKEDNIRVLGEVGDVREVYGQVDVLLAPVRIGGGTKFKILEAMATGLSVVTTSIGIEGIAGRDGQEVMIRDEAEGLAEATIGLLKDSDLRKKLANNARRLVEERYSWEKIVKKLEEIYKVIKISTDREKS